MPRPELFARLRASYVAATWRSPDSRIAAGVTAGVLLVVLALARLPIGDEVAIDLREIDHVGGAVQVTLLDFSFPSASGRVTLGPVARLVFNRPLPAAFVLAIEGRLEDETAEGAVEIRVGEARYGTRFDGSTGRRELHVRNPGGAREISLHLAPGARLSIERVNVQPEASVG
jgi:hypothetical protein